MNIKRRLYLISIIAILTAACSTPPTPSAPPTPLASGVPRFESTPCWFKAPPGQEVECGYLIVPEDHAKPDGATIKVAVARFKSSDPKAAPDPIVYLEGGPGGSPLRSYIGAFSTYFGPLLDHRDVILFDQRGTGYSQPALDCPEYNQMAMDTLDQNLSMAQSEELGRQALLDCHTRLAKEGVNLAAFNSAQNAADLAALQKTLGLEKINLYGISYGTRLALTAMRDAPTGIRSVVIDSVYPLQADLYTQTLVNGARAMEVLFHKCKTDPACSAAYPNLRDVFLQTVERLDRQPVTFTLTLHSGEKKPALMNGDSFMGLLFQLLYVTPIIPYLPRIIYDVRDGDTAMTAALQADFLAALDQISFGMHYSIQCQEEEPFSQPAEVDAAIKQYPDYAPLGSKMVYSLCPAWSVPTAKPIENQPVISDIPTLVFSGEFDPITPPAWGQDTARTLSRSFFFQLPHAGHGASISEECPRSIMLAFLDNPTQQPDSKCIADKMVNTPFLVPITSADITLKPFTESSLGISSVAPESWKKVAPGTYTPNGRQTDHDALLQQVAPIKPDAFLKLLTSQFEQAQVTASFEKTGSRTANGLTWTIYSTQVSILGVDAALAERDGLTYFVVLQSTLIDHKALYDAVFLPAIDALKPSK